MRKRFVILIEDDFEVKGNGLGNVAALQYLPALGLMNIARRHNVKLTFMVEVAHQLTLSRHIQRRDVRLQKDLWDHTVLLMKDNGFDVQLHIHPQWLNAEYRDGQFQLSNNWNIGCYAPEEQLYLITESVRYLKNLVNPEFPDHVVCAFKAGSWGLQPHSRPLLTALRAEGIRIVMGVRDGMRIPGASIDYGHLEERYLPYYPDLDDVTRKSDAEGGIIMLPLQPYTPSVIGLARLIADRVKDKLQNRMPLTYQYRDPVPSNIRQLAPVRDSRKFRLSIRPYVTHLKIGNQPYAYLKRSFDSVIKRLRTLEAERIPIVIESHTKQYDGYYEDIDRFLGYITERYGEEVEFGDMASFAEELRAPALPKAASAN